MYLQCFGWQTLFSPELNEHLEIVKSPEALELLTPAEKEFLKLIAKNHTGVEIGDLLCESTRTVKNIRAYHKETESSTQTERPINLGKGKSGPFFIKYTYSYVSFGV